MTLRYGQHVNKISSATPQSEAIPGTVPNNAGGYGFAVDDWVRLDRFLILGAEGGTYYVSERKLTRQNAAAVERCLAADAQRAIDRIVTISQEGRAAKNDAAIFALALAASAPDPATRKIALLNFDHVCRTSTHLFHFIQYIEGLRRWGRGLRTAVANWYLEKPVDQLAYQAVKYRQRDGWTHRDLLRLSHPRTHDRVRKALFDWICHRDKPAVVDPVAAKMSQVSPSFIEAAVNVPSIVHAFEAVQGQIAADAMVKLIREFNLPREALPTEALNDPAVWEALLVNMPMTAMIRNLGKMTSIGILNPLSDGEKSVVTALGNVEVMRKARIHPFALLLAQKVYGDGRGFRGGLTWSPSRRIVDTLDAAFYKSFKAVEPTGKRLLVALDVSGSMGTTMMDSPLTCREAAAAMAMVTMAVEPNHHIVGFTADGKDAWKSGNRRLPYPGRDGITPLDIGPKDRLSTVVEYTGALNFGATDCALPMLYALDRGLEVDAFVIYTDSETWAGGVHPVEALRNYCKWSGIPAKLVVVGMVSNGFSIADPNDAGMMDVVGFDTDTPNVIANFIRE